MWNIKILINLHLPAKFYQEGKARIKEKAQGRYQNLSNEEKEKEPQYGHERFNLSEDEK